MGLNRQSETAFDLLGTGNGASRSSQRARQSARSSGRLVGDVNMREYLVVFVFFVFFLVVKAWPDEIRVQV